MNADLVRVGDVILGTDGRAMRVLDVQHLYHRDGERSFDVRQILITLIAVERDDENVSLAEYQATPGV